MIKYAIIAKQDCQNRDWDALNPNGTYKTLVRNGAEVSEVTLTITSESVSFSHPGRQDDDWERPRSAMLDMGATKVEQAFGTLNPPEGYYHIGNEFMLLFYKERATSPDGARLLLRKNAGPELMGFFNSAQVMDGRLERAREELSRPPLTPAEQLRRTI